MIPITEKEEKALDNGFLKKQIDNITFNIESNQVIAYGTIDFTIGSKDFSTLENMNVLNNLDRGIDIPSDYDYDEHCCYPIDKQVRWCETTDFGLVVRYYHAKLGKPERCCIFKRVNNGRI